MKLRAKLPLIGGVNLLQDERALEDNETVLTRNSIPVEPGMMGKRKGLGAYGRRGLGTGVIHRFQESPTDFNVWYGLVSSDNLKFACNPDISNPFTGAGSALNLVAEFQQEAGDGGAPSQLTGESSLVPFNGRLYLFAGSDLGFTSTSTAPISGMVSTPVSSGDEFAFAGAGNESIAPRVAFPYRFRMAYGDFGGDFGSYLVFSDDDEADMVGDNVLSTRAFQIGARDSDRIIAGTEVMMSGVGSIPQSAILLLKRYSAYLITGEPTQSTEVPDADNHFGLADMVISRFNVDCGCASSATLVHTPYGIIWASFDNVWLFQPGQVPIQIGNKIAPRFKNSPSSAMYRWHAGYTDGFYRLAIFAPGQTATDNEVLCGEQWWLDLREGAPQGWKEARWYGPQVYKPAAALDATGVDEIAGTSAMLLHRNINGDSELLAAVTDGVDGTGQSQLAQVDIQDGYDFAYPQEAGAVGISFVRSSNVVAITTAFPHNFTPGDVIDFQDAALATFMVSAPFTIDTTPSDTTFTYAQIDSNESVTDVNVLVTRYRAKTPSQVTDPTIDTDVRSKLWDMGEPLKRKVFNRADLDVEVKSFNRVTLTLHKLGGADLSAITKPFLLSNSLARTGGSVDTARIGKEFQVLVYQNPGRDTDKIWRIQLTDEAGFYVTSDISTVAIHAGDANTPVGSSGLDDPFEVTIPTGWYATYYDLITAVTAALTADTGLGTFTHNVPNTDRTDMPEVVQITAPGGTFIRPILSGAATNPTVWNWLGWAPVAFQGSGSYTMYAILPQQESPFWALNPSWQFDSLSAEFTVLKGLPRGDTHGQDI